LKRIEVVIRLNKRAVEAVSLYLDDELVFLRDLFSFRYDVKEVNEFFFVVSVLTRSDVCRRVAEYRPLKFEQ
ncbi:MAG: hypothetical protein R6V45_11600, partial [Oceanipulchritudo sp.]